MMFRVLDDRKLSNHAGVLVDVKAGTLFDITNRLVSKKLLALGVIESPDANRMDNELNPRAYGDTTLRVGFFAFTSPGYSGGRIHLWQMAWTLAKQGANVWFVTNRMPRWAGDYPTLPNLFIVTENNAPLPPDLDYAVTDGKRGEGKGAIRYKSKYPRTKLTVINFETPKWVAKYDPKSASNMEDTVPVLKKADVLLANSDDSCTDVRENLGDVKVTPIPPAVNTYAIEKATKKVTDRPYVVWAARGSAYKGYRVALDAVMSYDGVLDLVAIGSPGKVPTGTDKHKIITFGGPITDDEKMAYMKGAVCVIAPSLFEGFGMVPGEALCCGTPVVAYDLPVLRANYGDRLTYAKWDDKADFARKTHAMVRSPKEVDIVDAEKTFGMTKMAERMKPVFVSANLKPRVSAQMICYYGPTVSEALESVYPHVDEIRIAYGPIELWKGGEPGDALDQIKAFPDSENKILLEVREKWRDKTEMRQWCADNSTGDRMLIVDADEIYVGLENLVKRDPQASCPRWIHFWHGEDHFVADKDGDARWGNLSKGKIGTFHPHYRWSHWHPSFRFKGTRGVQAVDSKGNVVANSATMRKEDKGDCFIYHLGHALEAELMKAKHDFYLKRDGSDKGRRDRKKAWASWEGKTGDQGDGIIHEVDWELPDIVKRAFNKLKRKK